MKWDTKIDFKLMKEKFNKMRKTKGYKIAKKILIGLVAAGITTGLILTGIFVYFVYNFTDPALDTEFKNLSLDYATVIYAPDPQNPQNEVEIETLFKDENRVWVNGDKITKYMKNALICIEDERFEKHKGVDWKRTAGAMLNYFLKFDKSGYGGSTITQQLIRNITGDDSKSIDRKAKEIFRALYIERKYSKEEILEYYLNTVNFGARFYGVQTAANYYFNMDVSGLTLAQAACIIGITNGPKLYDPYKNPEKNLERAHIIISKMHTLGKISAEERDSALAEKLEFIPHTAQGAATSKQSYFVDQLIKDVTNDLMKEKGYSESYAQNLLYTRGLKIYSTMDAEVQKQIDAVFADNANFPNIKSGTQTPQSAIVVMDPKTGDVVGMYGGKGPKEADMILNRATATFRQPGSCMKPVAVYAPSIESGIIFPSQVIEDSAVRTDKDGTPWPKNYTGTYTGPMTIKKAISNSVNTVAVKVLQMLGSDSSFDFLTTKLGITSLVKKQAINGQVFTDITDSLALGGLTKGVSVMELTGAYQIFPNHGMFNQPRTYTRVETIDGKLLLEKNMESSYAISSQSAFVMNQFLSEVMQTGTGTPYKVNNVPTAGKTGTTTEDKDRWFVGYTPYYVAGVWFGYDQPKPIYGVSGNPSGKLFKLAMDKIHAAKKLSGGDFEAPAGVTQVQYCTESGLLATANCIAAGKVDTVWFDNAKTPTTLCPIHSPKPTSSAAVSSTATSSTVTSSSSESSSSSSSSSSSNSSSSN